MQQELQECLTGSVFGCKKMYAARHAARAACLPVPGCALNPLPSVLVVHVQVKRWGIADLRVTGAAAQAQDYLCKHSDRIRRLADLQMERRLREKKRGRARSAAFSWIHKRELQLV